jgi:hypothetical protein
MSKKCPDCMDCGVQRAIKPGEIDRVCHCVVRVHDDVILPPRANPAEVLALMGLPKDLVTKVREACAQEIAPGQDDDREGDAQMAFFKGTVVHPVEVFRDDNPPAPITAEIPHRTERAPVVKTGLSFDITVAHMWDGTKCPEDLAGLVIGGGPKPLTFTVDLKLANEVGQRTYTGVPESVILTMQEMFSDGDTAHDVAMYLDDVMSPKRKKGGVVMVDHGPQTDLVISGMAGMDLPVGVLKMHIAPAADGCYDVEVGLSDTYKFEKKGQEPEITDTRWYRGMTRHDLKSAAILMSYDAGMVKLIHHLEEMHVSKKVAAAAKGRENEAQDRVLAAHGITREELDAAALAMRAEIAGLTYETRGDVTKIVARGILKLLIGKAINSLLQMNVMHERVRAEAAAACVQGEVSEFNHNIENETDAGGRVVRQRHTIEFVRWPQAQSRSFRAGQDRVGLSYVPETTYGVAPGSPEACRNKFNNVENFGGFPHIPASGGVVSGTVTGRMTGSKEFFQSYERGGGKTAMLRALAAKEAAAGRNVQMVKPGGTEIFKPVDEGCMVDPRLFDYSNVEARLLAQCQYSPLCRWPLTDAPCNHPGQKEPPRE